MDEWKPKSTAEFHQAVMRKVRQINLGRWVTGACCEEAKAQCIGCPFKDDGYRTGHSAPISR